MPPRVQAGGSCPACTQLPPLLLTSRSRYWPRMLAASCLDQKRNKASERQGAGSGHPTPGPAAPESQGGTSWGWVGLTHRLHEAAQLLSVGIDLSLQDVVLRDLLLQLPHARPVLALPDLLLQKNWPLLSPACRTGDGEPRDALGCLPCSPGNPIPGEAV